jgi:hypothetical protein
MRSKVVHCEFDLRFNDKRLNIKLINKGKCSVQTAIKNSMRKPTFPGFSFFAAIPSAITASSKLSLKMNKLTNGHCNVPTARPQTPSLMGCNLFLKTLYYFK